MIIDYEEIFKAWKASINPKPKQEELAGKRLDICLGCVYKKEVLKGEKWSAYCEDCGCPINKKIFSPIFNACTQKKWGDIDSEYLDVVPDKDKKSII
jgi:hypothetical protein